MGSQAGTGAGGASRGAVDVRVHLALVFVQVTFGALHVISKGVLLHVAPMALAGIRALAAAPLLFALAWHVERVVPERRDLPLLALLGALGAETPGGREIAGFVLIASGLATTSRRRAPVNLR